MSSVLKALRKLEEEKAALGESRVELARDILKRSAPRREASAGTLLKIIFFVVLLGSLVIVALLALQPTQPEDLIKSDVPAATNSQPLVKAPAKRALPVLQSQAPQVRPGPVARQPVNERVKEVVPEEEPVAPMTQQLSVPTNRETESPESAVQMQRHAPVEAPTASELSGSAEGETVQAEVALPEQSPDMDEPAAVAIAETQAGVIPQTVITETVESPAVVEAVPDILNEKEPLPDTLDVIIDEPSLNAAPKLPELTVNAIAYRPLPGDRLAIINNLPVMEGTSIEGVQIVEILSDGVRFSWHETEFILPLAD